MHHLCFCLGTCSRPLQYRIERQKTAKAKSKRQEQQQSKHLKENDRRVCNREAPKKLNEQKEVQRTEVAPFFRLPFILLSFALRLPPHRVR